MPTNKYWEDRANLRMDKYHKNGTDTVLKMQKAYDKAIKNINDDIEKIFITFASNGGLTPAEARKLLNSRFDVKNIAHLKQLVATTKDKRVKKYLLAKINANAYKARITRLEALKQSIDVNTKVLADIEIQANTSLYVNNINEAYYMSVFDIQKGLGIGFDFASMPTRTVEEILKQPWSGEHYSSRIWDNTTVLAQKLEEIITTGIMTGKSNQKMAEELQRAVSGSKFACERLIRTETTYITNQAELESYKECDFEKYVYIATLDTRTSETCRKLDNKIFKVDEAKAGVNLPPLHVFCRSTTISYFDDETLANLQRRARDPETGKTYILDKNMSYEEWYKEFVEK